MLETYLTNIINLQILYDFTEIGSPNG